MPSALGGRSKRSRGSIVKPDPDRQSDTINPIDLDDLASLITPTSEMLIRNGRSNAPAPSERHTEPEPLLREIRPHPDLAFAAAAAAAASPRSLGDSFFQTSFQDIGKKLKACNDTLGELQQLGVSHDVQLPELVLVGDQSAGKSTLMSGLANLELPRSEGTCTRCPLHIRVSRNSDWSCRVWLRKEYTYRPPDRPIVEADVTEEDEFFPWRKLPNSKVIEFKTMHDKSEIEEVLRWAQIAILNDHTPPSFFVPGSGATAMNQSISEAKTLAKFSPNVVSLEIKGPALPDLSFYDMPGIFMNPADANDGYLVNVVQNLSKSYIKHPSAIIIVSMPMNTDAENSCTFGLARKLGALDRTIGVLTKADLLPEGDRRDHAPWLDIMKGKTHMTGLGYFITSRRQDKDLEELTKWEAMMFEGSFERWPSAFQQFNHRCGVEKLKAFLSERLGQEFLKSLPNIKRKTRVHLDRILQRLGGLPELPQNVELEIQTCLNSFAESSRARIDDFSSRINDVPANFRDCLLEIKPMFTLRDASDREILELSDDESEFGSMGMGHIPQATPSSKRRAAMVQATPSKRPRFEQRAGSVAPPQHQIKPEESGGEGISAQPGVAKPPRVVLAEPFSKFANVGRGFRTLRQVHEEIQAKMKAGMPNIIPPEVYNDLAMEAIRPWKEPTNEFLRYIVERLEAELQAALDSSLGSLKKRFIYAEARRHLKACMKEHLKTTQKALEEQFEDETERLMTFNEGALKQCIKQEEVMLFRFRHQKRMEGAGFAVKELVAWETLTEEKQAMDIKRRQQEEARLKPDPFIREVQVVAYVRGYYRLAALRYADAISQRIICRMIPAIRRQLRNYLDTQLGVQGPDAMSVYERLMDEDAATAQKRESLKAEKKKFELALASIETLELGSSAAGELIVEESSTGASMTVGATRRLSDVTMGHDEDDQGEV